MTGNTDYTFGDLDSPSAPGAPRPVVEKPPTQYDAAWLESASIEAIDQAFRNGQLHTFIGSQVDTEGWPVGPDGKRLTIGRTS